MAAHLHLAPGQADEGPLVEGNLPQLGRLPGEGLQLLGHGPGDTRSFHSSFLTCQPQRHGFSMYPKGYENKGL